MKVLVTGGSGFLGKWLKNYRPNWVYVSSSDYDLTSKTQCQRMFKDVGPDAVVHLAARVGGIKDNSEKQAEYFYQNTMMNTHVIHEAYEYGVTRLLASLSTCSYPDTVDCYPFIEQDFFSGPPAATNFSYGFSKRMMHVQCKSYREQYGVNYSTFCPSNLYGPGDEMDPDKSHFVSAMIKKIHEAEPGSTVKFWGTGEPLRQQLYVDDLASSIPWILDHHNSSDPIIVAPDQNLSIREMIKSFCSIINKKVHIVFNGSLDGQYRKDGSNLKFKMMMPEVFKFTPFEEGIRRTYEWYKKKDSSNYGG